METKLDWMITNGEPAGETRAAGTGSLIYMNKTGQLNGCTHLEKEADIAGILCVCVCVCVFTANLAYMYISYYYFFSFFSSILHILWFFSPKFCLWLFCPADWADRILFVVTDDIGHKCIALEISLHFQGYGMDIQQTTCKDNSSAYQSPLSEWKT